MIYAINSKSLTPKTLKITIPYRFSLAQKAFEKTKGATWILDIFLKERRCIIHFE